MNEAFERVKNHVKENQAIYISAGLGMLAGAAGMLLLRPQQQLIIDSLRWKSPTTSIVQTTLERRGHPGFIVRCNETGEVFASQRRAASVMDINQGNLVSHLNGKYDHAGGYTFTRIGEAI